jgi:hypothetical protein
MAAGGGRHLIQIILVSLSCAVALKAIAASVSHELQRLVLRADFLQQLWDAIPLQNRQGYIISQCYCLGLGCGERAKVVQKQGGSPDVLMLAVRPANWLVAFESRD